LQIAAINNFLANAGRDRHYAPARGVGALPTANAPLTPGLLWLDPMFPLRNDPRFEKLAVRKRENGFLWLDGFRISHLSVPADMFAAVALGDGHNLDLSRYS